MTFPRPSRIALALACGLGGLMLSAEASHAQRGLPRETGLRIVHAVTDVPGIDVHVDDRPLFPEILYREITQYREPDPRPGFPDHRVTVRPRALPGPLLAESTTPHQPGANVTLAFRGANEDLGLRQIPLGEIDALPSRSRPLGYVRVAHLAPDLGPVELVDQEGERWAQEVAYDQVSDYVTRFEGQSTLRIQDAGGGTTRIELPALEVRQYFGLTIYLVGFAASDSLEVILDYDIAVVRAAQSGGGDGPGPSPRPTSTPRPEPASLRFLHALDGEGTLDLRLDGRPAVDELAFATASEDLSLDSGSRVLSARSSGSGDAPVLEEVVELPPGGPSTVVLHGDGAEPRVLVLPWNQVTRSIDGRARLRGVNVSADADSVDLLADAARRLRLTEGLLHGRAGDYVILPPDGYTLGFEVPGAPSPLARRIGVDLRADSWTSAFLVGSSARDSHQIVLVEDLALGTGGAPQRPGGATQARAVHAAAQTADVAWHVGPLRVAPSLAPRQATAYEPFTADRYAMRFAPAGQPGTSLAQARVTLVQEQPVSVLLLGQPGSHAVLRLEDDLSQPKRGHARVRLVHAAHDAPALTVHGPEGTQLAGPLRYGLAAGHLPMPAGFLEVEVRDAQDGSALGRSEDLWLKAGGVYTVVLSDHPSPGRVEAWMVRDAAWPDAPPEIDVRARLYLPRALRR